MLSRGDGCSRWWQGQANTAGRQGSARLQGDQGRSQGRTGEGLDGMAQLGKNSRSSAMPLMAATNGSTWSKRYRARLNLGIDGELPKAEGKAIGATNFS